MPYVKIWIHAVWATKRRERTLSSKDSRNELFKHIHQHALEKGILMDCVNGFEEHIHCLFRLKNDQTISYIMHLIKGESSFWANRQKLTPFKIDWQDDYFAVSVSESGVDNVRNYILKQAEHHTHKTFQQEYDEFIEKYGFKIIKD